MGCVWNRLNSACTAGRARARGAAHRRTNRSSSSSTQHRCIAEGCSGKTNTLRRKQPCHNRSIWYRSLPNIATFRERDDDILIAADVVHEYDHEGSVWIAYGHGIELIVATCIAFVPIAENTIIDTATPDEARELPHHVIVVGECILGGRINDYASQASGTPTIRRVRTIVLVEWSVMGSELGDDNTPDPLPLPT